MYTLRVKRMKKVKSPVQLVHCTQYIGIKYSAYRIKYIFLLLDLNCHWVRVVNVILAFVVLIILIYHLCIITVAFMYCTLFYFCTAGNLFLFMLLFAFDSFCLCLTHGWTAIATRLELHECFWQVYRSSNFNIGLSVEST